MLHDSLIYFTNYYSIVQVSKHISDGCIYFNYSDRTLFKLLENHPEHLNIYKTLIHRCHKNNRSLLAERYLCKYSNDIEWVLLIMRYCPIKFLYLFETLCIHNYHELAKQVVEKRNIKEPLYYKFFEIAFQYDRLSILKHILNVINDSDTLKKKISVACWISAKKECQNMDTLKWLIENNLISEYNTAMSFWHAFSDQNIEIADYLFNNFNHIKERYKPRRLLRDCCYSGNLTMLKWMIENRICEVDKIKLYQLLDNRCLDEMVEYVDQLSV